MYETISINSRGVVTIPAHIRRDLGLKENDELIVERTAEGILLRPSVTLPVEIYTDERIAEFFSEEEALEKLFTADKVKAKKKKS